MDELKSHPRTAKIAPGQPLAPEPIPADYDEDVPQEMFDLIDATVDQNVEQTGTRIASFRW